MSLDAQTILRWQEAVESLAGEIVVQDNGERHVLGVARPELKLISDEMFEAYLDALADESGPA